MAEEEQARAADAAWEVEQRREQAETAAAFKATRLDEETRRKIQLIKDGKWW